MKTFRAGGAANVARCNAARNVAARVFAFSLSSAASGQRANVRVTQRMTLDAGP